MSELQLAIPNQARNISKRFSDVLALMAYLLKPLKVLEKRLI